VLPLRSAFSCSVCQGSLFGLDAPHG
jgi:hypothetical protein